MKAVLGLIALALAGQAQPPDAAPRITQQEFKKLIADRNVVVVDTRNAEAYGRGHIPGAILLPLEGLPAFPPEYEKTASTLKASGKPIVTYCA